MEILSISIAANIGVWGRCAEFEIREVAARSVDGNRGAGAKTVDLNNMVGTLNSTGQIASRVKRIEDSIRHFDEFPENDPVMESGSERSNMENTL